MRFFSVFSHKKVKIGLALGGGGARGFAHLGVIKAFEEYGLKFDFIAGTSIGSIIGAYYAAGYDYERMYQIAKEIDVRDLRTNRIFFMPSKTDGLEKLITETLGNINIEDLKIPYAAVAVDLKSTEEIYFSKGNLAKAVAGSCCVPGFFHPVEYDDYLLADGGLRNTLPSNVCKLMGCDYVVAVDINKSRGYGTESSKVLDVLACTIRILMKSNVVKGYLFADVVLRPETKKFKATKKTGFEEMIEEGYKEAIENMDKILKLYSNKPMSKRKKRKFLEDNEKF